jgi:hypothetical protein
MYSKRVVSGKGLIFICGPMMTDKLIESAMFPMSSGRLHNKELLTLWMIDGLDGCREGA